MTRDDRSDEELVVAAGRGEAGAFDALYFRHAEWVHRLAWRFCRNETDAGDVTQEVFIYLAKKCATLELRAALRTLLYPAVKNTSLAILRKKKRRQPTADGWEETLTAPPPPPPERDGGSSELATLLNTVPETFREVLLMRFIDELSLEDIAHALALPVGTVKSRLHHAISFLRNDARMRKYFEDAS